MCTDTFHATFLIGRVSVHKMSKPCRIPANTFPALPRYWNYSINHSTVPLCWTPIPTPNPQEPYLDPGFAQHISGFTHSMPSTATKSSCNWASSYIRKLGKDDLYALTSWTRAHKPWPPSMSKLQSLLEVLHPGTETRTLNIEALIIRIGFWGLF